MAINGAQLKADLSRFYIVTPIINSPRYRARAENYLKFKAMCEQANIKLVTVECAFGDRPFEVTQRDNPMHVQVRSKEEYWAKEVMLNVAFKYIMQIDPSTQYLGWFDSDQFPLSITPQQWFDEIWHQLQHYEFVQCWEYLQNFGPDGQPLGGPQMSFMKTYAANGYTIPKGKNVKHTLAGNSGMVSLGRPGLAWAASVDALNKVGGLMDFCILGSADWHMSHALVGGISKEGGYSWEATKLTSYMKKMLNWQELCERHIKRDVGYVPVTVGHWYHGNKENRKYGSRGEILIRNQYNPNTDIKYDTQGMIQLESWEPRQIRLRDEIRSYLASRNEDDVAMR